MCITRRHGAFLCAVLLCLSFAGCAEKTAETPAVKGSFDITVMSAGQADAMVLTTQNHCIVIDCGEKDDGDELVELLGEKGIEKIDSLIITHFDKDHVGGAAELIENTAVERIITPNYEGSGKEYDKFIAAAAEKDVNITKLRQNTVFTLDDVSFGIYPPLKADYEEDDNDFSLAVTARHGQNSFLFAGDAESERIKEILAQVPGKYSFLKVPHHGRYCDNTEKFINAVSPDFAVITCSEKNPAEAAVVDILEEAGSAVYYTADGTVNAASDGERITVTQDLN